MKCLCCSGKVLRHFSQNGLYGYCLQCRQVMPMVEDEKSQTSLGDQEPLMDFGAGRKP